MATKNYNENFERMTTYSVLQHKRALKQWKIQHKETDRCVDANLCTCDLNIHYNMDIGFTYSLLHKKEHKYKLQKTLTIVSQIAKTPMQQTSLKFRPYLQ